MSWTQEYITGFGISSDGTQIKVALSDDQRTIVSFKSSDEGTPGDMRTTEYGDFYYRLQKDDKSVWMKKTEQKTPSTLKPKSREQIAQEKAAKAQREAEKKAQKLQEEIQISNNLGADGTHAVMLQLKKASNAYFNGIGKAAQREFEKRGITEAEVQAADMFTINNDLLQQLGRTKKFPGFPSTNKYGVIGISFKNDVLVIPSKNSEGKMTGAQLMPLTKEDREGGRKYVWMSSKRSSAKLADQNFEYPLPYSKPQKVSKVNENMVLVTEGFLKSVIAANRFEVRTIGCAGNNWYAHETQLLEILRKAKQESPNPDEFFVAIAPDAGMVTNSGIVSSFIKTVDLLQKNGYPVKILWWEQFEKRASKALQPSIKTSDIDELGAFNPLRQAHSALAEDAKEQGTNKLNAIAVSGKKAKLLQPWQFKSQLKTGALMASLDKQDKTNLDLLEYPKDFNRTHADEIAAGTLSRWNVVQVDYAELDDAKLWENYTPGLFGVRSVMGSGKTVSLIELVVGQNSVQNEVNFVISTARKNITERSESGYVPSTSEMKEEMVKIAENSSILDTETVLKIWNSHNNTQVADIETSTFMFGHRNSLLSASCKKLGLSHREEMIRNNRPVKNAGNVGLCVDSLQDIPLHNFRGATILIDESSSVFSHLLIGATCKDGRSDILDHTRAAVRTALNTGGRVILLDANLDQSTLYALDQLISPLTPRKTIIDNPHDFSERKWQIGVVTGTPGTNKLDEHSALALIHSFATVVLSGTPSLLVTDGKKTARKLDKFLKNEGKQGLLICADTLNEENRKFMKNPDEYLQKKKFDYVIFTPTVDAGLSITCDKIDMVFGAFFGVISPDAGNQMLGRIRRNVPRFIWAKPVAIGHSSLTNSNVEDASRKLDETQLLQDQKQMLDDTLKIIGYSNTVSSLKCEATKTLGQQCFDVALESNSAIFNRLVAIAEAKSNRESVRFRNCLLTRLEKDGHHLFPAPQTADIAELIEFAKSLKACADELTSEEACAIANAEEFPTVEELNAFANSESAKEETGRVRVTKGLLQFGMGHFDEEGEEVVVTPELAQKFAVEDGGQRMVEMRHIVGLTNSETVNTSALRSYLYEGMKYADADAPTETIIADMKKTPATYEMLRELGILDFLNDPEREWSAQELMTIFDNIKNDNRKVQIARKLSLPVRGKTTETNARKFADKLVSITGLKFVGEMEFGVRLDTSETFSSQLWAEVLRRVMKRFEVQLKTDKKTVETDVEKRNVEAEREAA